MKKNMGKFDRLSRTLIALLLIGLVATNVITGITSTVFLVIASVFIFTSVFSNCPLYSLLGWNTCGRKQPE